MEAPAASPELVEERREALLAAMPELREILDQFQSRGIDVDAGPSDGHPVDSRGPEAIPGAHVERELLARLGAAASASVRAHADAPPIPDARQRDADFIDGRAAGLRLAPTRVDDSIIISGSNGSSHEPIAPAAPPAPPRSDATSKRVKELEAETRSLKSVINLLERGLADLERSMQHQLSAVEERLVTAVGHIGQRQAALDAATGAVDPEAIEHRVIARLQPFDSASVEQRLTARLDELDPEGIEARVADRLAELDPATIEERIVTRLQAGGVRDAAAAGSRIDDEFIAELESRIVARVANQQLAVLDERLATQLRALDPAVIEERVIAAIPTRTDFAVLEAKLIATGAAMDTSALEARIDAKLAKLAESTESALSVSAVGVDVEDIERRITARVTESLPTPPSPVDDTRSMEAIAEITSRVVSMEARFTTAVETVDFEAVQRSAALEQRFAQHFGDTQDAMATLEERVSHRVQDATRQLIAGESSQASALSQVEDRLTRQVNSVDQRLTARERFVDDRLSGIDRALVEHADQLRRQVGELNEALETIAAAPPVSLPSSGAPALADPAPAVDPTRVAALEARLASDVESIMAAVATLTSRIDDAPTSATSAGSEELAALDARVSAELVALQAAVEELATSVSRTAAAARSELSGPPSVPAPSVTPQALADLEAVVAAEFGSLRAAIDELSAAPASTVTAEHLTALETRVGNQLRSLSAAVSDLSTRPARESAAAPDRLDDLEVHFARRLDALDSAVDELTARPAGVTEQIAPARIEELEARVAAEIGALRRAIDQQTVDQRAQAERPSATAPADVAELEQRVAAEMVSLKKVMDDIEPIRQRIGRLGLEMSSANEEIVILREHIDKRIGSIESRADVLAGKVMESSSVDISVYLDRIAEIERAISELDPDRFALADDVRSLAQRLDDLPSAESPR